MNLLYWCEHEMCNNPRIRVWTDDQANYGQFDVIDHKDFLELSKLFDKYKWNLVHKE
jgi:hypothetical protein